jgi:hypothetical protein
MCKKAVLKPFLLVFNGCQKRVTHNFLVYRVGGELESEEINNQRNKKIKAIKL